MITVAEITSNLRDAAQRLPRDRFNVHAALRLQSLADRIEREGIAPAFSDALLAPLNVYEDGNNGARRGLWFGDTRHQDPAARCDRVHDMDPEGWQ